MRKTEKTSEKGEEKRKAKCDADAPARSAWIPWRIAHFFIPEYFKKIELPPGKRRLSFNLKRSHEIIIFMVWSMISLSISSLVSMSAYS